MKRASLHKFRESANVFKGIVAFFIGFGLAIPLAAAAVAADDSIAISEFFVIKKLSSGIGAYKRERNDIYVRLSGDNLEYIGTSAGGPPSGVGFLGDAIKDLRAITMAVSKDGRSLVFRHLAQAAPGGSKLESGIHQYVYGGGIKILYKENELSGLSYTRWRKAFPPDILPFNYRISYTPRDLLWALKATGETFPLALYEASPLHWAAFEGRTDDCVTLVKSGADINAKTYWDFTSLDVAIIRNHEDTAIQLLTLGATPRDGIYPAFHRAVMLGRMKVVQFMLDRGVDVNETDGYGNNAPLHLAVYAGAQSVGELTPFFDNAETPRSIMEKNITTELVQLLLDKGADPNIRAKNGKTPLESASKITPTEVTRLLSERSGK